MVGPAGPLATISREPGQARKGAAAAVTLCAGVWLVGFTSITIFSFFLSLLSESADAFAGSGVYARLPFLLWHGNRLLAPTLYPAQRFQRHEVPVSARGARFCL
jgi:hypothetical protein